MSHSSVSAGPLLVAHKGVWSDLHFPQDTVQACERALAHGFEAVEVDIQMTADGVLVLDPPRPPKEIP